MGDGEHHTLCLYVDLDFFKIIFSVELPSSFICTAA